MEEQLKEQSKKLKTKEEILDELGSLKKVKKEDIEISTPETYSSNFYPKSEEDIKRDKCHLELNYLDVLSRIRGGRVLLDSRITVEIEKSISSCISRVNKLLEE